MKMMFDRQSKIGREQWRSAPCANAGCEQPAPSAFFCQKCIRTMRRSDVPWAAMPHWHVERAAAIKADRVALGVHDGFRTRGVPEQNLKAAAYAFTRAAIANGFLVDPRSCDCVDCGGDAECYDHRDYSKPMMVEPVCKRCNASRGRGYMPPLVAGQSATLDALYATRPADQLKAA